MIVMLAITPVLRAIEIMEYASIHIPDMSVVVSQGIPE
jgi:hypothetical protein